jgi:hypothetical protein
MMTFRRTLLTSTLFLPAAFVAAAPQAALAQDSAAPAELRPLTAEDVARIEFAASIAISQDGSRIAYTTGSRPDVTRGEANGGLVQQLFLADAPMQARAYLPGDVSAGSIGFTPDGSMITYLWADGEEKRAVWGVPVNGGAPRKLAGVPDANVLAYAVAPSGESVYMLASPAPDTAREGEAAKGFTALVYEEEERFNRLFVAAAGGTEIDAAPRQIAVPGQVDEIDLAPDGSFMVVTSAPTALVDDNLMKRRPHILDLATSDTRMIETLARSATSRFRPMADTSR